MKLWIIVILSLIAIAAVLQSILYRRQMHKICRQLKFIRSEETNKLISIELYSRTVRELAEEINLLLKKERKNELLSQKRSCQLKETITNISHDIRTPLTSLDGYFQLLMCEKEEKQRRHYADVIDGRIRSLKEILEQLFTYVRLQDPEFTLELEQCNLTQLLSETLFAFYDNFKRLNFEPEIQLPEELIYIMANETGLRRTLQNIIKNILDHNSTIPTDSELKQSVSENPNLVLPLNAPKKKLHILLKKCLENSGQEVQLEIKNVLPEGKLPDVSKVFERFYTQDQTTETRMEKEQSSTGLGLFIAKELVEKMEGKISAAAENGYFSIVLFFPICPEKFQNKQLEQEGTGSMK